MNDGLEASKLLLVAEYGDQHVMGKHGSPNCHHDWQCNGNFRMVKDSS